MRHTILFVDDHPTMRLGIKSILQKINPIIYEAGNGVEALAILQQQKISLVILDMRMPQMDGIDAAHAIRKKYPRVKILMHSNCENYHLVNQLIEIGVKGFHCKRDTNLLQAVEVVMKGQYFLSTELRRFVNNSSHYIKPIQFTSTETKILALCATGLTSQEISNKLGLQVSSIETYRKRLIRRMKAKNITEVVDFAHRIGKL